MTLQYIKKRRKYFATLKRIWRQLCSIYYVALYSVTNVGFWDNFADHHIWEYVESASRMNAAFVQHFLVKKIFPSLFILSRIYAVFLQKLSGAAWL